MKIFLALSVLAAAVFWRRSRQRATEHGLGSGPEMRVTDASKLDVTNEDQGASWADDGGAAPGKPGDDALTLSAIPTAH